MFSSEVHDIAQITGSQPNFPWRHAMRPLKHTVQMTGPGLLKPRISFGLQNRRVGQLSLAELWLYV